MSQSAFSRRVVRGSFVAVVAFAALIITCTAETPRRPQVVVVASHPIVAPTDTCPAVDPPPAAEPSKNVPTLAEASQRAPLAEYVVLVVNAREMGVNNRAIRRLYTRWQSHRPGSVELVALKGLPLSHDIIEPLRPRGLAARVYPEILAAIDPDAVAPR